MWICLFVIVTSFVFCVVWLTKIHLVSVGQRLFLHTCFETFSVLLLLHSKLNLAFLLHIITFILRQKDSGIDQTIVKGSKNVILPFWCLIWFVGPEKNVTILGV